MALSLPRSLTAGLLGAEFYAMRSGRRGSDPAFWGASSRGSYWTYRHTTHTDTHPCRAAMASSHCLSSGELQKSFYMRLS